MSQLILCEEGLPDGSYDGAYVPTGGNGESYRLATIAYSSGFVEGAQLRDGAIYNPATQGAIQALTFSYDAIYLESFDSSLACFPVLVQGATWYGGPQTSFCACQPGWRHQLFSNLSAAQFFQIIGPGPRRPNFSKFGGPIQFGFGHLIGPSACFDRAVVRWWTTGGWNVVAECAVPVQVMTWGAIKVAVLRDRHRGHRAPIAAGVRPAGRIHETVRGPGIHRRPGLFHWLPQLSLRRVGYFANIWSTGTILMLSFVMCSGYFSMYLSSSRTDCGLGVA